MRPRKLKSLTDAAETGAGEPLETGGVTTGSMFVVARNLDPDNDTLEVVADGTLDGGEEWGPMVKVGGDKVKETADAFEDPDDDGNYAAMVLIRGISADKIRARISSITDDADGDLTVDVWVSVTANASRAWGYREMGET